MWLAPHCYAKGWGYRRAGALPLWDCNAYSPTALPCGKGQSEDICRHASRDCTALIFLSIINCPALFLLCSICTVAEHTCFVSVYTTLAEQEQDDIVDKENLFGFFFWIPTFSTQIVTFFTTYTTLYIVMGFFNKQKVLSLHLKQRSFIPHGHN